MNIRYQNPVYPFELADPFVLKTAQGYYAYGTGPVGADGQFFPVLRSEDLARWRHVGGALTPLEQPRGVSYWAPEVIEKDGCFHLFYSASTTPSDESHRLRLATSSDPAGPFVDSGKILLPERGFTIDASPFFDPVSRRYYLFFANDYESDAPVGTGVALVRLDENLSPVGAPVAVARALADWQIYQRQRDYKGRVWDKWYCVEGPHCLFHQGVYFCFFSAGAWFGDNYGVGFAWANRLEGPWHDDLSAIGPAVLKGIPGKVIGPGHSSCVLGPDDKTLFLAYHAWDADKTARRMCIDPILWQNGRPVVDGPTTDPRTIALQ